MTKKSSLVLSSRKPQKFTRNLSFSCPQDVMDLSCNFAYQLVAAFSRDMMNDFVRVVSSPPAEAIEAS
jgi:hypothetical protein